MEASSSPPGLKIEGEQGFQNVLGHRPEVALGKDGEFVSGDHILSSGIKVAGYVTAVVALEGLQAHPTPVLLMQLTQAPGYYSVYIHVDQLATV